MPSQVWSEPVVSLVVLQVSLRVVVVVLVQVGSVSTVVELWVPVG